MRRRSWIMRSWLALSVVLTLGIVAAVGLAVYKAAVGPNHGVGKVQAIDGREITLDFYDMRIVFTCDDIPEWVRVGQWVEAEWSGINENLTILGPGIPPSLQPPWTLLVICGLTGLAIVLIGVFRIATPAKKKKCKRGP